MNRRDFLQKSTLIIPGLTMTGILATIPRELYADTPSLNSFSFSVISDQPEKTIRLMQELLNHVQLQSKNIHYTDYQLQGKHIADIAFTRSGQLIDFRKKDGRIATELRKIAAQLDFPRVCYDPVLIHFSCEQGVQEPTGIQIYNSNKLILEKTFPAKTEIIHLEGLKGNVVLELAKDHSVRFVESSCKHKTCMTMGAINKAGQNLVCIPNQIAVTINGINTSGVDSITF